MTDWVTGLVAVTGVLGALGGVWLGSVLESRRDRDAWRRSERTRWVNDLHAAYARFLADTEALVDEATWHPKDELAIAEARDRARDSRCDIEPIAEAATDAAAGELFTGTLAVVAVRQVIARGGTPDPARLEQAETRYGDARRAFKEAVRRSLRPADPV